MQGLYVAAAAALVTAVANDKIMEIANICAELMRLGWVKLVGVPLGLDTSSLSSQQFIPNAAMQTCSA